MSEINSEELKKDLKGLNIAMIGFPVRGHYYTCHVDAELEKNYIILV